MKWSEKVAVIFVLLLHTILLAWSAIRHSPVVDELGHMPAGLSHWKLQRFDLYNVNPPLVRTVATLPLHLTDMSIAFAGYQILPKNRSEFMIGSRWITAHPDSFLRHFTIARWACIPFSLLGAVTCFLWARELSGHAAGLTALCLWCFSPNILAHGSLITPDAGATAIGVTACYVFRKWLAHRTIGWAAFAGLMLGLTLLTKFTWLFLLGLWPLCWLVKRLVFETVRVNERQGVSRRCFTGSVSDSPAASALRLTGFTRRWRDDLGHIVLIMTVAFWVLNSGYLFEDSFQRLGDFQFFSQSLSGREPGNYLPDGANRFRGTLLGQIPMPVPRNFLQGIDHIKYEYEEGYPSYLRGVKRHGGWWYYYLYAMLVKMPVGTLMLIGIALGQVVFYRRGHRVHGGSTAGKNANEGEPYGVRRSVGGSSKSAMENEREAMYREADASRSPIVSTLFETVYLLAPAISILWLVSSQTGFNHHLRYVLPAFPFLFIFASRTALLLESRFLPVRAIPIICVAWMISSSLSVYPHSLSYFNELAGGPINGWKHLDYSNIDWGQDMILVKEWVEQHPDARPLHILQTGYVSPQQMGIDAQSPPLKTKRSADGKSLSSDFAPGWYIIGLTRLVDPHDPFHEFLGRKPDDLIGYSMRVYHVSDRQIIRSLPISDFDHPE